MTQRFDPLLVALAALPLACVAGGRPPLGIREPEWKGTDLGESSEYYEVALRGLDAIAGAYPAAAPIRITSRATCILRIDRGDAPGTFADASRPFRLEVTWIDLRKVLIQEVGRSSPRGEKGATTCAELRGQPGLAVSTEVAAATGESTPARRVELVAVERPRFCVAGNVEPKQLGSPLQRLVSVCDADSPAARQPDPRPVPVEGRLLER